LELVKAISKNAKSLTLECRRTRR